MSGIAWELRGVNYYVLGPGIGRKQRVCWQESGGPSSGSKADQFVNKIALTELGSTVVRNRRELEFMLHLGRKAEIQVIASTAKVMGKEAEVDQTSDDTPLIKYLVKKIHDHLG